MVRQAAELSYAIRLRVVFKLFGQLCLVLAILSAAPVVVAVLCGEYRQSLGYAAVVVILLALGSVLARLRAGADLQANEALVLAASTFLTASLLMTIPFMYAGLEFADALFEAVSGCTTTGLTTLDSVREMPASFLFARAWMQWYGGLGIVVFSVALFVPAGETSKALVSIGPDEGPTSGARVHARRILIVYCVLTAVGLVLLLLTGVTPLVAVNYVCAAVSTGGFAPRDASLAALGGAGQFVLTVVCVASAVSLSLYIRASRFGWRGELSGNLQLRWLVILGLLTSCGMGACLLLVDGLSWPAALHHAPLLGFSAQTTTGFATLSVSGLDSTSKLVLILSMLIGGGAGSSAGGIKIFRLLIVARVLQVLVVRTCLPRHAVLDAQLSGRRLESAEIEDAFATVVLFATVIAASWLPFVAIGYNPLDALFEVVSATGTVGLSTGISDSGLPAFLKGVLCVNMLLGRLEVLAWLVLCYPRTWFGKRAGMS
jgi:trk system potassium uptake protein TrkH